MSQSVQCIVVLHCCRRLLHHFPTHLPSINISIKSRLSFAPSILPFPSLRFYIALPLGSELFLRDLAETNGLPSILENSCASKHACRESRKLGSTRAKIARSYFSRDAERDSRVKDLKGSARKHYIEELCHISVTYSESAMFTLFTKSKTSTMALLAPSPRTASS